MGNIANAKNHEEILARIMKLSPESKAQWGIMNVHQMLTHCADPVRCARGDFETKDVSTWAGRTIVKNLVLMGMKVPKGKIKTVKEFDPLQRGTKTTTFEADRETLIGLLTWLHSAGPGTPLKAHPYFGPMTKSGWGVLTYTHMDHHLRQFGA